MFGASIPGTVRKIVRRVSVTSPGLVNVPVLDVKVPYENPLKAATDAAYAGRNVLLRGPPLSGKKTAANQIADLFNHMGIDVSCKAEIHPTVFSGHVGFSPEENINLFTCMSSQFILRQTEPYIQHDPSLLNFIKNKKFVIIDFNRDTKCASSNEGSSSNGFLRAFVSREESKIYNNKAHAFETLVPSGDVFLLSLCQTRLSLLSKYSSVFKVHNALSAPIPLENLENVPPRGFTGFNIHYHLFPLLDMGLIIFESVGSGEKMSLYKLRSYYPFVPYRRFEKINSSFLTFLHSAAWITQQTPILYDGSMYRVIDVYKNNSETSSFSLSDHPISLPSVLLQCEKSGARVVVDPIEAMEPDGSMSGFNASVMSLPLRPAAHSVALVDILKTPHLPNHYTDYITANIGVSDDFIGPNCDIL